MAIGLDELLKKLNVANAKPKLNPISAPFVIEIIGMLLLTIPFIIHHTEYLETKIALGFLSALF